MTAAAEAPGRAQGTSRFRTRIFAASLPLPSAERQSHARRLTACSSPTRPASACTSRSASWVLPGGPACSEGCLGCRAAGRDGPLRGERQTASRWILALQAGRQSKYAAARRRRGVRMGRGALPFTVCRAEGGRCPVARSLRVLLPTRDHSGRVMAGEDEAIVGLVEQLWAGVVCCEHLRRGVARIAL